MENPLELPPNFQELMMEYELEFQSEINEANIRKLIYIYTLGMQHYNLIEKMEFQNYYRTKLNNLLLNENVIKYLDTHKVDLSKKVDINIFDNNNLNNIEIKRKPSIDIFRKKIEIKKQDLIDYIAKKIKQVDIKMKKIDKKISDIIVEQMENFESEKRTKKVKKINIFKKSSSSDIGITDDIDLKLETNQKRKRGSNIGQNNLLKEIEEYVENNMKDMYKALEELKLSYEGEIKEAVDSGFNDIAESLKNDLKYEEENLIAQYEEERMKQVELIRQKHKK